MVSVRLHAHDRSQFESLGAHLVERREVVAVYQTAGTEDFLVLVAATDSDHLRDFVMEQLADRPEVAHLETNLLFDVRRKMVLPSYAADDPR
jgi:DNA-binding Lrp family transcriptional regulator